jgi:hypothetical protein
LLVSLFSSFPLIEFVLSFLWFSVPTPFLIFSTTRRHFCKTQLTISIIVSKMKCIINRKKHCLLD